MNQRRCWANDNGAVGESSRRGMVADTPAAFRAWRRRFPTSPLRAGVNSGLGCAEILLSIITPSPFSVVDRNRDGLIQFFYFFLCQAVDLFGDGVFYQEPEFRNGRSFKN